MSSSSKHSHRSYQARDVTLSVDLGRAPYLRHDEVSVVRDGAILGAMFMANELGSALGSKEVAELTRSSLATWLSAEGALPDPWDAPPSAPFENFFSERPLRSHLTWAASRINRDPLPSPNDERLDEVVHRLGALFAEAIVTSRSLNVSGIFFLALPTTTRLWISGNARAYLVRDGAMSLVAQNPSIWDMITKEKNLTPADLSEKNIHISALKSRSPHLIGRQDGPCFFDVQMSAGDRITFVSEATACLRDWAWVEATLRASPDHDTLVARVARRGEEAFEESGQSGRSGAWGVASVIV